jgi:hypothetical protein
VEMVEISSIPFIKSSLLHLPIVSNVWCQFSHSRVTVTSQLYDILSEEGEQYFV